MQAIFGARGSDVKKTRGFGILGFGVEAGGGAVGWIGICAGRLDRSEKQTPWVPAFAGTTFFSLPTFLSLPTRPSLSTCSTRDHLTEQQQIRVAAARSLIQSRHDDGAELEALGLVDG